jgi:hypothetical protein
MARYDRHDIHVDLDPQDMEHLHAEAHARRISVRQCARELLHERLTGLQQPAAAGPSFDDLMQMLRALEVGLDQAVLQLLSHLPEIPPARRAAALESGERRHALWQAAVQEWLANKKEGPST